MSNAEVVIFKNLKIPFKYRPFHGMSKTYIKDYNVTMPFITDISNKEEVRYTISSTILLLVNKEYYYCPMLEEVYKNTTVAHRVSLLRNIKFRKHSPLPIVQFTKGKAVYKLTEVKRVLFVNEDKID